MTRTTTIQCNAICNGEYPVTFLSDSNTVALSCPLVLEARQSALQNERTTVPFRSALHARKRASTLKQKPGGNHMPQTLLLIDGRGPCPRPRTEIRIRGDMHQRSRDNTDRGTARRAATLLAVCPLLASCTGVQSALDPAGEEAAQVATLFWVMTIGGGIIWAGVVALSLYASRWKRGTFSEAAAGRLILWAGVVFPVTVLTALLALCPLADAVAEALCRRRAGETAHRGDRAPVLVARRLPPGRRRQRHVRQRGAGCRSASAWNSR